MEADERYASVLEEVLDKCEQWKARDSSCGQSRKTVMWFVAKTVSGWSCSRGVKHPELRL